MSSGPAGSTPSTTRLTPEVITATHSVPDGLGNQRTASGVLDLGKARSRRAGGATGVTCGTAGAPNSLNCAFSTPAPASVAATGVTPGSPALADPSYTGGGAAPATTLAKSSVGSSIAQKRPAHVGPRTVAEASSRVRTFTSPASRASMLLGGGVPSTSAAAVSRSIHTTASCAVASVAPCRIVTPPVRCQTS